jgi:fructosamine-3-kinase
MASLRSIEKILQEQIAKNVFSNGDAVHLQPVGGGSINTCYRVSNADRVYFCKVNSATKFPHLFESEKQGLLLLAAQNIFLTPAVLDQFEADEYQFLLLEWIEAGVRTDTFWKTFGEKLAMLHRVSSDYHGLGQNNYMGSVPQQNTPQQDWVSFFRACRLQPMIKRCAAKGNLQTKHIKQFEVLEERLPAVFEEETPSLLHGDLWSGNFMCNAASEPVLIDPAVHYGHRSVDLAMTTLFGGFRQPFYEAYQYHFPLPANYEEQWAVCNLYPLLIHLFLFGSAYLPQIERTLQQFG